MLEYFSEAFNIFLKCIGVVAGLTILKSCLAFLLSRIFGSAAFYIFDTKITFIGVIVHELAHTIGFVLTGAKVVSINLFNIIPVSRSLGSVEVVFRGPLLLRSIQRVVGGTAPIIAGFAVTAWMRSLDVSGVLYYLLMYAEISIIYHTALSKEDILAVLPSLPFIYLGLVLYCKYRSVG